MVAQQWKIVGGGDKGGVLVRESQDLASKASASRLATDSIVEQLELHGDRLWYKLVTGAGPTIGWISIRIKGKELAVRHDNEAQDLQKLQSELAKIASSGKENGRRINGTREATARCPNCGALNLIDLDGFNTVECGQCGHEFDADLEEFAASTGQAASPIKHGPSEDSPAKEPEPKADVEPEPQVEAEPEPKADVEPEEKRPKMSATRTAVYAPPSEAPELDQQEKQPEAKMPKMSKMRTAVIPPPNLSGTPQAPGLVDCSPALAGSVVAAATFILVFVMARR